MKRWRDRKRVIQSVGVLNIRFESFKRILEWLSHGRGFLGKLSLPSNNRRTQERLKPNCNPNCVPYLNSPPGFSLTLIEAAPDALHTDQSKSSFSTLFFAFIRFILFRLYPFVLPFHTVYSYLVNWDPLRPRFLYHIVVVLFITECPDQFARAFRLIL